MLPIFKGPTHAYVGASPACWRLYGQVSKLSRGRPEDRQLDRLVVDAYGAQHPGRRQVRAVQSIAVHLMGLCTVLERGAEPRIAPGRDRKRVPRTLDLHWLEPPRPIGTLTVRGPLRAQGPEDQAVRVEAWARDVWGAWAPHHETVRSWLDVASRRPDGPSG